MANNSNNRTIYYHGCGKLKYEFMVRHGALPAFTSNGALYVSAHKGTAYEYALNNHGLDDVIIRVQTELELPEVSGMEPLDLAIQLRSIIENIRIKRGFTTESVIKDRKTHLALAGYFPISSKEFRKAFLKAREEISSYGGFIFALLLEGETMCPNTFPGEATDYGVKIPLVGAEKSKSATSIEIVNFARQGISLYKKRTKEIPSINLDGKLFSIEEL